MKKQINREKLLKALLDKPVKYLIVNIDSDNKTLKNTSLKALIELSKNNPDKLYPYFSQYIKLLDSDNNIMLWTGIIIIGNIATVDIDKKIDAILPRLFKLLNIGKMITANNTIQALGKIAVAKPYLSDNITTQLLKITSYKYDTAECSRIACGQVILAFEKYLDKPNKQTLNFIKTQTNSSRHATALKAQKLAKKYGKM